MSNSNFNAWSNDADMPMKDSDGKWYDAETGIYFNPALQYKAPRARRQNISSSAQASRNEAKMLGGKALKGTKKQKEWAEQIRASKIDGMDVDTAKLLVTSDLAAHSVFWIENRNKTTLEYSQFVSDLVKINQEVIDGYNKVVIDKNHVILNSKEYDEAKSKQRELLKSWGF